MSLNGVMLLLGEVGGEVACVVETAGMVRKVAAVFRSC